MARDNKFLIMIASLLAFAAGLVAGTFERDPPQREVERITINGIETNRCTKWYHTDRINIDCETDSFTIGTDTVLDTGATVTFGGCSGSNDEPITCVWSFSQSIYDPLSSIRAPR